MTYNKIFDIFFSYWYINFICLALLMLLSYYLRNKYFARKIGSFGFRVYSWGFSFVWLITYFLLNPMYLGFGKPYGVSGISASNGKAYVVDYILTGGDEVFGASKYSRIHILDENTGKKILRFPVGEDGTLRGIKGDSLIFWHYNDADIFSASTGKSIAKWNNKTLPKIFPELSAGIDHTMIGDAGNLLELTTLDGNQWNLSLKTGKLWAAEKNRKWDKFTPSNEIYLQNDNEIKVDDGPGGNIILQLRGIDGNQEIRYLKQRNDSVVNPALKFIHGKFIALSVHQKCFVILSFENTTGTSFILTGISLDGKDKLWTLEQSQLRPDDDKKTPISICWGIDSKTDVLFFGLKDEVIAIQMLDGNLLWRQKL